MDDQPRRNLLIPGSLGFDQTDKFLKTDRYFLLKSNLNCRGMNRLKIFSAILASFSQQQ